MSIVSIIQDPKNDIRAGIVEIGSGQYKGICIWENGPSGAIILPINDDIFSGPFVLAHAFQEMKMRIQLIKESRDK